jgi:hypothetical protein
MEREQKRWGTGRIIKLPSVCTTKERWMTSLEPPPGYEICPHCEGDKLVLYEGKFERLCRMCNGTGMIDWVRNAMRPDMSNREKPMRYLEQIKKRDEFRKRMKERIKNDKYRKNDKSKSKC